MKKVAVVLVPFLLMACTSAPKTDSAQISPSDKSNSPVAAAPQASIATANSAEIETKRLADELAELQKQNIYFDFDKYAVKAEYQGVIQQQAAFLKAHKNDSVTIEGNADERGSEEYNLALGDRRANAARKNLEVLGVPAAQIHTISLGEEKPRLTCHAEKCWKEDRRDDFIHKLN